MTLLANMGTPLMHMGACFLLFLNAFIGWFEGWWIARTCGTDKPRTIGLMIVANYLSAWMGAVVLWRLAGLLHQWVFTGPPLYSSKWVLVTVLLGSLVGTLAIEAPFVACAALRTGKVRSALRAFAGAQLMTYTVTLVLFLLVSRFSVVTGLRTVPVTQIVTQSPGAWVYYLDSDRQTVRRIRLDGTADQHVVSVPVAPKQHWRERLYAMPALWGERDNPRPSTWQEWEAAAGGLWDLWITGNPDAVLIRDFALRPGVFRSHSETEATRPDWWPADMRQQENRPWEAQFYSFAETGLVFFGPRQESGSKGPRLHSFAFAHPFEGWNGGSITIFPTGLLVLEFGPAQIVLIDYERRRIAALVRGYSPVVAIDAEDP
jgi:hypothetical protein